MSSFGPAEGRREAPMGWLAPREFVAKPVYLVFSISGLAENNDGQHKLTNIDCMCERVNV